VLSPNLSYQYHQPWRCELPIHGLASASPILIMKSFTGLLFFSISLPVVFSKNCTQGTDNKDACVFVFQGDSCEFLQTSYSPDCSGNCYGSSFNCLALINSGYQTTCTTYSDSECKNVINGTLSAPGDGTGGGFSWVMGPPVLTPGGMSMKCYNNCNH
jgi:hypothetical protein